MTTRRLMTWLFDAFLLLPRGDVFASDLLDGHHLVPENNPQL